MKYYKVDFKIQCPAEQLQDACDITCALAGDAGFETFEQTETGVCGYVQQQLLNRLMLDEMINDFPMEDVSISYTVAEAPDEDWNATWEQEGFSPIVVGNRLIVHDGRHLPEQAADMSIEIDAHLAFGTGTHETTRMVLTALLDLPLTGKRMLDCGCGTGILGIAALKMGASEAVGYDIDEWSADNARHNAVINQVDAHYKSLLGDVNILDSLQEHFDVVAANINRNILLADMARICQQMAPECYLIISGFYTGDIEMLVKKTKELRLQLVSQLNDNDWACLVFKTK